jgi:hypothetical protein
MSRGPVGSWAVPERVQRPEGAGSGEDGEPSGERTVQSNVRSRRGATWIPRPDVHPGDRQNGGLLQEAREMDAGPLCQPGGVRGHPFHPGSVVEVEVLRTQPLEFLGLVPDPVAPELPSA